jgi:hypothetical protein
MYRQLYKTVRVGPPEEQIVLDFPPTSEILLYTVDNARVARINIAHGASEFGTVYLTEYRLIFVPDAILDKITHLTSGIRGVEVLSIPIGSISESAVVTKPDEVELRLGRKTASTLVLAIDRLDNPGAEEEAQAMSNEIGWRHVEGCAEYSVADHELPLYRRACSNGEQGRSPTPGGPREATVLLKPQPPTAVVSHAFRRSIALSEHGSLARTLLTTKGTVDVGRWGGPGPKVVDLPSAGRCASLKFSNIPANKQSADYTDKFEATVVGSQLQVRRVDEGNVDGGWGQRLVLNYTQKDLHDDLFDDDSAELVPAQGGGGEDESGMISTGRRILEDYRRLGVTSNPLWRYATTPLPIVLEGAALSVYSITFLCAALATSTCGCR